MKQAIVTALSLLIPSLAGAAEKPYCVPLAEVDSQVEFCYQNEFYTQAAELCLQKLQNDVNQTQAQLARGFTRNDAASASAQRLKQQNMKQDLHETNVGFLGLLARAKRARAELSAYVRTMILPGAPSEDIASDPVIFAIMSRSACYANNRVRLEQQIADLDKKISELQAANGQTVQLHQAAQNNLQRLGDEPNRRPASVRATVGQGSALPARKGHTPQKASTITGQIKNEKLP